MGASSGGGRRRGVNEINITPFVDVVLVLLVIFMVTATLIVRGAIPIKLPEVGTADNLPGTVLVLGVDAEGTFAVKGRTYTSVELETFISETLKDSPDAVAVISGDRRVPYGKVMELIDMAQRLGVKQITAEVVRKLE
ncbi:MAG: biopolymer transporter ExbD [Pseudomonadota bacterium]